MSDDLFVARIEASLAASGLAVERRPDPPLGTIVFGNGPNCRMWARNFEPYGNSLSYYQEQASSVGPLRFVYRNRVYDRPPKIEPLMRFYLSRELARARLHASRWPIVAVAASPHCKLDTISWNGVSEVPW
ncbi:MAG: hypothetical protein ABIO43_11555 [Sphingomicrobium sp.]